MTNRKPTFLATEYDFADGSLPSVADVARLVSEDPRLGKRRGALLTTLRRITVYMGLDARRTGRRQDSLTNGAANTVPFVAPLLREALNRADPVQHGLSRKSIQNDRSNVNFLLGHYGLGGLQQYLAPLTDELQRFHDRLAGKYLRCSLSRFLHFLAARQLSLDEVDDEVSHEFLAALEREGLIRDPRVTHQNTTRAWNRAVEQLRLNSARTLTVPRYREPWAFRWEAFPQTLRLEIDRFLAIADDEADLFDPNAPDVPLTPRTIETQREWTRVLASGPVRSGVSIDELTSLTACVRPPVYKAALLWLIERRGGKPNRYVAQIAFMGRKIARYGSNLDADELREVERLYKRVATRVAADRTEPKRFQRLRQFEDRRNLLRLIALSDQIVTQVEKRGAPRNRDALDVQLALAHELLLATTLRRGNLVALDLTRHFVRSGPEHDPVCRIHVPADEIKNGVTIDCELPSHVVHLLDLYLDRFRPLLADQRSPWLFPGTRGSHKKGATFCFQYARLVKQWTGLDVTPHLIRSIADKIYMDLHPEGAEVMRRQLGHTSGETRMKHYADPRSRAANRAYLQVLLGERDDAMSRSRELFR